MSIIIIKLFSITLLGKILKSLIINIELGFLKKYNIRELELSGKVKFISLNKFLQN